MSKLGRLFGRPSGLSYSEARWLLGKRIGADNLELISQKREFSVIEEGDATKHGIFLIFYRHHEWEITDWDPTKGVQWEPINDTVAIYRDRWFCPRCGRVEISAQKALI